MGQTGLGTPFFSVRYITFFSILKKECSVLFHSFLEFLATYETQKNPKNTMFFCKERKRTQRTECSFAKNIKELKNVSFFCKRTRKCSVLFSIYIKKYIYIYIYIYVYINIYRKKNGTFFKKNGTFFYVLFFQDLQCLYDL